MNHERAFQLVAQVSFEAACSYVNEHRVRLVAGPMGKLFRRPRPEEIQLVSTENRLEGFWHVSASAHTTYDRSATYGVRVGDKVTAVTVHGRTLRVKDRAFELQGIEHCREERHVAETFDGMTGQRVGLEACVAFPKQEIQDLDRFAPDGVLVVPPRTRATAVVHQAFAELIRPVRAEDVHEDRITVEAVDLYFRPIYAFEYEWAARSKRVVVEYDALTNATSGRGKKWIHEIQGALTREVLFDLTAEAIGLLVPGGGVAATLAKAVVQARRKHGSA